MFWRFCFMTLALLSTTSLYAEEAATFDLVKVFMGCPIIYTLLSALSLAAFMIWFYSILTLRSREMVPSDWLATIRGDLIEKNYEKALEECMRHHSVISTIVASALSVRKYGQELMINAMEAEGRRCGNALWQRISLLNEIAVVAPMIGLLGTVLGLFFAFYDSSRSPESLVQIFDGLGMAVGTTVAGLIVAIVAMIFQTTLKFKVVKSLNAIESESIGLVNLIEKE